MANKERKRTDSQEQAMDDNVKEGSYVVRCID